MNKKVSVIIPFYNGVEWLSEAVQSVLNQTYNNIEIIVINDGSPENIDGFLKKFGDKIIYKYKENGGAATARNLAMSIATGDYLAFLDSDDIWLPDKTEKQVAFMESAGAAWSHTGFYYWNPMNDKLKKISNEKDYGDIYLKTFVSVKIATPSVIVDRRVFREHPEIHFPPELRKGQDTAFFRQLSTYYNLALLQEPLVKVRLRGNNSNTLAITRFSLKGNQYLDIKHNSNIPKEIKFIGSIYYFYNKIFGIKTTPFKEFLAKCLWSFPYYLERLYVRKIERDILNNNTFHKYLK